MAGTSPSLGPPASPVSVKMRIPKDQAKLLNSSDSWIGSLKASNHRLGLVNLPADILTSLTDFHRRLHQNRLNPREAEDSGKHRGEEGPQKPEGGANGEELAATSPTPEAGTTSSPATTEAAATGAAKASTTDAAGEAATEGAAALDHGIGNSYQQPESSPPSPASSAAVSWSQSPPEHFRRGPPRTTVQPQPPASSLDVEEELEVVPPQGVRDTAAINGETGARLPSSLSYTSSRAPPCGQGEYLNGTVDADEEPEDDTADESKPMEKLPGVPQGRRGRRMRPPAPFSSDPVKLEKTAYLGNRLATAKVPPEASHLALLDRSQASVSSNIAPTSPANECLTSSAKPNLSSPPEKDPATSPRVSSSLGKRQRPQTPQTDHNDEPASRRGSPGSRKRPNPRTPNANLNDGPSKKPRVSRRSASREVLVPATLSDKHPDLVSAGTVMPSAPHPKPFDMYKESYPTYPGGILDFVRACICLEYLQSEDLMRDMLYDDLIFAFATGYADYVGTCAAHSPLPVHRWFNRLGGKVISDKMVITRQNLRQVLEAYPEEFQAVNSEQSPQRAVPSRAPTPIHPRPGSTQEAVAQLREAATTTPKGRSEQHVPDTRPRASGTPSEAGMPCDKSPSSRCTESVRHGSCPVVASSPVPVVIPATQSPGPAVTSQRSRLESSQDLQIEQLKGKRPTHPQTPHSVVAESPYKRIAASRDQPRRSLPPNGLHPFSDAGSGKDPASEERPAELSITKITSKIVAPVRIRGHSPDTIDLATPTTAQVPKEAKTTLKPRDVNAQHRRPFAETGTSHARRSNSSSTGGAGGRGTRPSSKPREESVEMEDFETRESRFFREREARSPDLHSSAYTSLASPKPNATSDRPATTSPALVETQSARKATTGARPKEMETRPSRHSIATSQPRASLGNDTLTKTSSGRVQKDAGRRLVSSKGEKKKSKLSKEEVMRKRDEALKAHIRKVQAQKDAASASPASPRL